MDELKQSSVNNRKRAIDGLYQASGVRVGPCVGALSLSLLRVQFL